MIKGLNLLPQGQNSEPEKNKKVKKSDFPKKKKNKKTSHSSAGFGMRDRNVVELL